MISDHSQEMLAQLSKQMVAQEQKSTCLSSESAEASRQIEVKTLNLLSYDQTWTRVILVLLQFSLHVSVACGQIRASLDEDQPTGRRERGEEDEGGSTERGDPHVSRFTVASIDIVLPNSRGAL